MKTEITRDLLVEFYYKNSMTQQQIADNTGWSLAYISKKMKEFNIKALKPEEQNKKTGKWDNYNWLYKHYIDKKMSSSEIGKMIGLSPSRVRKRLKKYGIRIRNTSEAVKLRSDEISEFMTNKFRDPENRKRQSNISKELWSNSEHRAKCAEILKKKWRDKEWANKKSKESKDRWNDPEFRRRIVRLVNSDQFKTGIAKKREQLLSTPSFPEKILYSILDDLNINYIPEKVFGIWNYDVYLPDYNIVIESQSYWHLNNMNANRDKLKANYLKENHPGIKLKYIWDYQYGHHDLVRNMIKNWCNISDDLIDFEFDDIVISNIDLEDAKLFVAKYHYLGKLGNSSIKIGACLNGKLIALCIFGAITRKESAERLNFYPKDMLELTRFVIHPSYQKKNFATWFISRCIKNLKAGYPYYKCLISFADTTFNHIGTIYKASNWLLDGKTNSSYWYVDDKNNRMHKKTLWNMAKNYHMSESEFAERFGYKKIKGKEKIRYLYYL